MRFAVLVLKNALRNKRRTILTVFGLAASLFLVVTLDTVLYELQATSVAPESELRLWVRHAISIANVVPLAYQEQIRRLPGVKDITVANWFGGIYVDQSNFFAQFAVDADRYFRIFPELGIDPEQLRAFQREKTAAVAGVALARRFNWKRGDHITLRGTYLPADAELTLAGTFTSPNPYDETVLLFHYDYLYELMGRRGLAGAFCVLVDSRESLPRIAKTIDDTYASSTAPTKTETEKAFQQSFGAMLGNVKLLIRSISVVVVFTILLVTAASMGMSIRERTAEVGILKTLGYSSGMVLALLLSEALLLAVVAAALGCGGAELIYSKVDLQAVTAGFFSHLRVQPSAIMHGALLGLGIGFLAAVVPAWRAARLPVAEAIRHIG